jgi:hypothetical protein
MSSKALEVLNAKTNFLPIKKARELTIDHEYRILFMDTRKGAYGKRTVLTLSEGNENFLLYLGPSYAETKKGSAIKTLLADETITPFIILKDMRKDGQIDIPEYSFIQKPLV